jgi:hypothetical protein
MSCDDENDENIKYKPDNDQKEEAAFLLEPKLKQNGTNSSNYLQFQIDENTKPKSLFGRGNNRKHDLLHFSQTVPNLPNADTNLLANVRKKKHQSCHSACCFNEPTKLPGSITFKARSVSEHEPQVKRRILSNQKSVRSQWRFNSSFGSKNRVKINVGGVRFETYQTTLRLIPDSRLANISPTNSDYDPIRKEFFFDRDPVSFQAILNYYRTGRLHAPGATCGTLFFDELSFWDIGERSIQPCCWTAYNNNRECEEILKKVMGEFGEESIIITHSYYISFIAKLSSFFFFNSRYSL